MLVIVKATKVDEYLYLYDPSSARKVSRKSADEVCIAVNLYKSLLDTKESEIWKVIEIDETDPAFEYAQKQAFTIRNGIVTARSF